MNKFFWMISTAALFAAGAAHAQGYGYEGGYLPPPAYAYYGAPTGGYGGGCGDRFTIVGAHAGVTVLGIDVGGGAGVSVGGYCNQGGGYAPQAYAPPQPVYQPAPQPVYQPAPPPMYYPAPQAAPCCAPPPPPCGCQGYGGW